MCVCLMVYALCLLGFAVGKERRTTGEYVKRSVNIFTKGRKTGFDYFCALPQGLQVSFETNSQLW